MQALLLNNGASKFKFKSYTSFFPTEETTKIGQATLPLDKRDTLIKNLSDPKVLEAFNLDIFELVNMGRPDIFK